MAGGLTLGAPAGTAPTHGPPDGPPDGPARIGPNAITRIAQALDAHHGGPMCRAVFTAASLGHHLAQPPTRMVAEPDVLALHAALVRVLGPDEAARIGAEAGRLTGAYLLAHRIPALVQAVLRRLPRRLAARLLARAITRHAWTFAGSGRCSLATAPSLALVIEDAPLCQRADTAPSGCPYLAATLETLFRAVTGPGARVTEQRGQPQGTGCCSFELAWV